MPDDRTTCLRQLRKAAQLFLLPPGYRFSTRAATRYYQTLRASGETQHEALEATAARFNTGPTILQRIVCGSPREEQAWTQLAHAKARVKHDTHVSPEETYEQALAAQAATPHRVRATQGRSEETYGQALGAQATPPSLRGTQGHC